MKLYLMRHSLAAPVADSGVSDDGERPLTPEGEERARLMGCALKLAGIAPKAIWTSPLLRARQTAGIVSVELGCPELLRIHDVLSPGMTCELFMDAVRQNPAADLLVVGHQPDMGEVLSWFLWGPPHGRLSMTEAAVACLDLPSTTSRDRVRLVFLLSPAIAATIASGNE